MSEQKSNSTNRSLIFKYKRTHHNTKVSAEIKRNKWKSNF